MQFSLAEKTGLPMLLHCRNSADDFLGNVQVPYSVDFELNVRWFDRFHFSLSLSFCLVLADLIRKHRDRFTTGVVHSFTGTVAEMNRMLEQGLYIGQHRRGLSFYPSGTLWLTVFTLAIFQGINGCSMKSVEQLDVVKSLPLDRMMLETGKKDESSQYRSSFCMSF